jgi:membrane-bound lytic murein transglycosylase A
MCVNPTRIGCWSPPANRKIESHMNTGNKRHPSGFAALFAVVLSLALAGCAQDAEKPREGLDLHPVDLADLPGWKEDQLALALPALRRSCKVFSRYPADRAIGVKAIGGVAADWLRACEALPARDDVANVVVRDYLKKWFQAYQVVPHTETGGLFTGYYEPELKGSRTPGPKYQAPIYGMPPDLVLVNLGDWREDLTGERIAGRLIKGRLKPYDTRANIQSGSLNGKLEPLIWAADPIDVFFLQIQGSGRVVLEDGTVARVGYGGHNGHVYYPIGRYLVEREEIDRKDVSLQSIRAWLRAHPKRMHEVMNLNPSFIFFREIDGDGPIGALGVALTPGRSLAIDRRHMPLGAPVWVNIDYDDENDRDLRRLMVAQDTGGAIRGTVRGDVFWGHGEAAALLAGPMAARGEYYLLLPKDLEVALTN